jgi:hypothetical protein
LARLNHPSIVAVYDFGEADGRKVRLFKSTWENPLERPNCRADRSHGRRRFHVNPPTPSGEHTSPASRRHSRGRVALPRPKTSGFGRGPRSNRINPCRNDWSTGPASLKEAQRYD